MAKRAQTTKKQRHQQQSDVISVKNYKRRDKHVQIIPKSIAQEEYLDLLENDNINIAFAMGPAGTGKTMLGVLAAVNALKQDNVINWL